VVKDLSPNGSFVNQVRSWSSVLPETAADFDDNPYQRTFLRSAWVSAHYFCRVFLAKLSFAPVKADLSPLRGSAEAKQSASGTTFWRIIFSIEIHFGLTEFRARVKWVDGVSPHTRLSISRLSHGISSRWFTERAQVVCAYAMFSRSFGLTRHSIKQRPRLNRL
jgi:hypothetical protein